MGMPHRGASTTAQSLASAQTVSQTQDEDDWNGCNDINKIVIRHQIRTDAGPVPLCHLPSRPRASRSRRTTPAFDCGRRPGPAGLLLRSGAWRRPISGRPDRRRDPPAFTRVDACSREPAPSETVVVIPESLVVLDAADARR